MDPTSTLVVTGMYYFRRITSHRNTMTNDQVEQGLVGQRPQTFVWYSSTTLTIFVYRVWPFWGFPSQA